MTQMAFIDLLLRFLQVLGHFFPQHLFHSVERKQTVRSLKYSRLLCFSFGFVKDQQGSLPCALDWGGQQQ